MKSFSLLILLSTLTVSIVSADYIPSDKIFTYQGRLIDDNAPSDGFYDISFRLLDGPDPDTASAVSYEEFYHNQPVRDGYFTVDLNFAPFGDFTENDMLDGSQRWLWIGIRAGELNDPNEYTYLNPLTELIATPYAHTAHTLQTPNQLRTETTEPVLTIANEGDGPELLIGGNGTLRFTNNAFLDILNNYIVNISNSLTWTVTIDSTENIGSDRSTTIGGTEHTTVGMNSTKNVGGTVTLDAGDDITLSANNLIQLQNKVSVSNDPNDLLKIDGAVSMLPLTTQPPLTTTYGKLFIDASDDKIYFQDRTGNLYDLTALTSQRVSFSVKRNASYTWPSSSSFETVDFVNNTDILDNTGYGFDHKNGIFVAPADGLYTFHGTICFNNLAKGDLISAAIYAADKRFRGDMTTAAGTTETVHANITVYLQEGQQARLEGYLSASAPPVYVFGTAGSNEAFTYFNGARVD